MRFRDGEVEPPAWLAVEDRTGGPEAAYLVWYAGPDGRKRGLHLPAAGSAAAARDAMGWLARSYAKNGPAAAAAN